MSQTFVLKEFVLQTSPAFLKEYCQLKDIPLTIPDTQDEDAIKESIIGELTKLDDKLRSALELDFQEINSLSSTQFLGPVCLRLFV